MFQIPFPKDAASKILLATGTSAAVCGHFFRTLARQVRLKPEKRQQL